MQHQQRLGKYKMSQRGGKIPIGKIPNEEKVVLWKGKVPLAVRVCSWEDCILRLPILGQIPGEDFMSDCRETITAI